MPKTAEQKTRLLRLLEILERETDDNHPMTEAQLRNRLSLMGIEAERKTILSDLHALENFGIHIVNRRGRNGGFFITEREFELSELKLLVDAVQTSRSISEKRCETLVRKLRRMTSIYKEEALDRPVYVCGRVKQENKLYSVALDVVYQAIRGNLKLSFIYNEWTINRILRPKRDTGRLLISPWRVVWEAGNCYLVGYDEVSHSPKRYRVDKMTELAVLEEHCASTELYEHMDPTGYTGETYGMYDGEEKLVTLLCDKRLLGVIFDRFGTQVTLVEEGEERFSVTVCVRVSPDFRGWVLGYGAEMRVMSPADVAAEVRACALAALAE